MAEFPEEMELIGSHKTLEKKDGEEPADYSASSSHFSYNSSSSLLLASFSSASS